MGKPIKIKRGLNIPLKGEAKKEMTEIDSGNLFALKPTDFHGIRPRVLAKPGTFVKVGSPVFMDKFHPEVQFCSPVSGVVKELVRGEKRKLLEIVIESDEKMEQLNHVLPIPDYKTAENELIKNAMLTYGYWPMIIQRPYGVIADPDIKPNAVFVSAFDSAPLAPDNDFFVLKMQSELQVGIDVLHKLSGEKINLGIAADSNRSIYSRLVNVEVAEFVGPHPAGNVGTQINKIRPINKGELFWTLNIQDVVAIGRFFMTKKIDYSKVIAMTGSDLKERKYVGVFPGQSVSTLLSENLIQDNVRVISGNVLTGTNIGKNGYLSYYDNQISVIPEGDYYELLGWVVPGFKKFSVSRTFFSWLFPKKKYRLDTNYHGGERAYVMTGEYEKVCPLDIYPQQLVKACLVNDIDKMEQLGIYEVVEEDLALCEFVCTSKIEVQSILRKSLDMLREEMS